MPRKSTGSKQPGKARKKNVNASRHGDQRAEIVSLTSSPAFDQWLELQTKKLVESISAGPDSALIELIRGWPGKSPRKGRGKITD